MYQINYLHYKFQMVPIVITEMYIRQLSFTKIETERLVRKLQNMSASGTVKRCKTFLSFHDS